MYQAVPELRTSRIKPEMLLAVPIIGVTFFNKIAVPISSSAQINVSLIALLAVAAVGFAGGHFRLQPKALMFYVAMVGGLIFTQLFSLSDISTLSILLVFVVNGIHVFQLKDQNVDPIYALSLFQKIMLVTAFAGIAQYFLQFAIGDYAFFLDAFVPKQFIQAGYNNMNAMTYMGTVYKSNGFFFKEPSTFCQMLAIAVIVEITTTKQFKRLPIYFLAIGVTFSGTGLIILFIALPIYLISKRQFLPLILMAAVVAAAPVWMPAVGLSKTLERASEITNPRSSAYARFVSMAPMINQYLVPYPDEFTFGKGAGSLMPIIAKRDRDYEVHNPTWGKIFFEYGLFGTVVYFLFLGYIFAASNISGFIKLAIMIQFLILGEYLTAPDCHALIAAMMSWSLQFKPGSPLAAEEAAPA